MYEMTTLSIPGVLPDRPLMSSKEISKLTGKRHSDILRDIRSVLNELYADDYHNAKLRYEKNQLLTIVEGIVVNIDYRGMEGRVHARPKAYRCSHYRLLVEVPRCCH